MNGLERCSPRLWACTYRLVSALEAVRTRRIALGFSPEMIVGGAAAAVKAGVPQMMVARLIRVGLPSRRAAIAAIEDAEPVFVTPAEMQAWLDSDEVTDHTDAGDWPTPETAVLWARFRTEALSGGFQKWSMERSNAYSMRRPFRRLVSSTSLPRMETDGLGWCRFRARGSEDGSGGAAHDR